MANSAQARKRARQNNLRNARNSSQHSTMRTAIKRFIKALNAGEKEAAQESYRVAVANIDKIVRKGLEHKNKAARLKSRLNARLKTLVTA